MFWEPGGRANKLDGAGVVRKGFSQEYGLQVRFGGLSKSKLKEKKSRAECTSPKKLESTLETQVFCGVCRDESLLVCGEKDESEAGGEWLWRAPGAKMRA